MRRVPGLPVHLDTRRIFLRGFDTKWAKNPDKIIGNPNWNVSPDLIGTDTLEQLYLTAVEGGRMTKGVYGPELYQATQDVKLRQVWEEAKSFPNAPKKKGAASYAWTPAEMAAHNTYASIDESQGEVKLTHARPINPGDYIDGKGGEIFVLDEFKSPEISYPGDDNKPKVPN